MIRDARPTIRFGPLTVTYDRRVLRPRPWTVAQAEWVGEVSSRAPSGPILELHCGAGQIGLLAAYRTRRPIVQIDRDFVACDLARLNADGAGLGERVEVRVAELASGLLDGERFPIIVADPPYVPTDMVDACPDDPIGAIDGGTDGLDAVRGCLEVVAHHLAVDGCCIMQLGTAEQADRAAAITSDLRVTETRRIDSDGVLLELRHGPAVANAGRGGRQPV